MKGRSRKGCVMGTSIHKNKASSSPVKFLGGIVDAGRGMVNNVRDEFQNITQGHLPPPPPQQPTAGQPTAGNFPSRPPIGSQSPGRGRLREQFRASGGLLPGRPDQLV